MAVEQIISTTVDDFYSSIALLYSKLVAYRSWEPTSELLKLYANIVSLCVTDVSPAVEEEIFNDPRILELLPRMRTTWGEARGALEDYWSNRITSAKTTEDGSKMQFSEKIGTNKLAARALLEQYPSLENYRSMCPLEMGVITTLLGRAPHKIAMIGCGPLPLTALSYKEFAESQGNRIEVLNIDIVFERIEASQKFCTLIGCNEGMTFLLADGRSPIKQLAEFDVVLLASVAGVTDEDKSRMMGAIAEVMKPKSLLLTRGSNGLNRILYPKLDFRSVEKLAPSLQPTLTAVPLDGPTKHGMHVLRKR